MQLETISHYKILKRLGAGGMGEVYLANDTSLYRRVAIKFLPQELESDEQAKKRLIREARAAANLDHPNICTIHEVAEEGGKVFIVMQYVEGETIAEQMRRKPFELIEAINLVLQVADALSEAHSHGIIHRDIKPQNIIVNTRGQVKVLDFGLAKTQKGFLKGAQELTDLVLTNSGEIIGTAPYLSPEQARAEQLDTRSDIFSFGTLLYEMVTSRHPFKSDSTASTIAAILMREPPSLKQLNRNLPDELQYIASKALRKERDERYSSIDDLIVDLKRLKRLLERSTQLEPTQPVTLSITSGQTIDVATPNQLSIQTDELLVDRSESTIASGHSHRPSNPDFTMISGSVPAQPAADRKPWLWLAMGAAGAAVISAIIILAFQFISGNRRGADSNAPFDQVRITKLTNTGIAQQGAISPDGKYVAHAISDGGRQSLWVRHVATSRNVEIVPPTDGRFGGISFSRDSNYIYYTVIEKNRPVAILYQIGALGGTPKRLVEDVDSPISISPDNSQFVFMRNLQHPRHHELVIASMDGSNERTLAVRTPPQFFYAPAWSPDGKTIACSAGTGVVGAYMNVVAVNVADGTEKPITPETWLDVGRVSWIKDGTALIMTATDPVSKVSQVWRVAYPSGETRRITNDLNQYVSASLTEDSNTLAVVEWDSLSNLWMGPSGDANRARQITPGVGKYGRVSWTPDGKVLYNVREGADLNIWRMDADGSNPIQLTADTGMNFHAAASPDGRYIVFASTHGGGPSDYNIWRMDADGRNPKQLTQGGNDVSPAFSPDNKWVVYQSHVSGRPHLWKVPSDGGQPIQLTGTTSVAPTVSPDGRYIACGYWDEQLNSQLGVAVIPFEGGQPIKSFNMPQTQVRWTSDGSGLMYLDNQRGVSNVWLQPFGGGAPRQLTNFKSDLIFSFDWSRDNNLICSRGIATSDIVMITGFK